jgi:hypothetical protein
MSQSTPINLIRRDLAGGGGGMDPSQMQFPQAMPTGPANNQQMMMDQQHQMMQQQHNMMQQPQEIQMPMPGDGVMRSDTQLVEDILKEMGSGPGSEMQSNINSQAYQYATDNAQVPPHKYVDPNSMVNLDNSGFNMNSMNTSNKSSTDNLFNQISFSLSGQNIKSKLMNNLKYPVAVFIICFLLGLPEFNRFLFNFFPKLLLESGQVTIGGVALRSLIGMIIFIIISIFI